MAAVVAFIFYPQMLHFLQHPYCQRHRTVHCQLYVTGPLDGLSLRIKMAAFGGLVLASPVILWEVWRFITPGLNPTEKRYAIPSSSASIVLFLRRLRARVLLASPRPRVPRAHRRPDA